MKPTTMLPRLACSLVAFLVGGNLVAAAVPAEGIAQTADQVNGSTQYHLTFNDEFNQYDPTVWQTSDFWGMRNNAGDYQAQWFCDPNFTPADGGKKAFNPFSVKNGILSIVAQPTPEDIFSGPDRQPYVSGQLTSAHKFTQRYGYFELRAKLPPGKGLWSRFWLLTDDGVWPGEYDVFEVLGKNPKITHQTTHFRDIQRPHAAYGAGYEGINPTDGQFHTYGFLWEKAGVTWYVDGVPTLRQINRINIPMYVLIDLVVGKDPGNLWPGNPDDTNTWPTALELDYYRVYSNDPSLPSVTPQKGYTPSILPNGFTVVNRPTKAVLPPSWAAGDVGTPDLKGSSTWNPETGEWMLKGAGYGNQGQFAGKPTTGDAVVTATVTSSTIINGNDVRAGVAFREDWKNTSKEVSLVYLVEYNSPKISHSIVLQSRGNGPAVELARVKNTDAPAKMRLMRSGNTFTASYSTDDGRSWMNIGEPQDMDLPETVQAGLVVGGNQNSYQRLSRAIFQNVTVTKAP